VRGVPFIFSSGYSAHDMRDGYRDRPVLKKPFQYEELVQILTRLLARRSSTDKLAPSAMS
jgi:hypothetical protein